METGAPTSDSVSPMTSDLRRRCAFARARWTVAALAAFAVWAIGSAASTWAAELHSFSTSFNGGAEHALSNPQGVAINQSTGDVYVVDRGNNRVEVFDGAGTFLKAFGQTGSGNGEFNEPTEIAVDNSGGLSEGDVYVVDGGQKGGANRVEIFNSEGQFLSVITRAEIELKVLHKKKNGKEAEFFEFV
ncbi:MAG TPA: NHL repeat-containing protein, partial [Solirubrobacteraceae bacterium]